jgi:hypothetical protein
MDGRTGGWADGHQLASMSQIVHVVSMLDVPTRLGSMSFQSKDVSGAQKSLFLFCEAAERARTPPSQPPEHKPLTLNPKPRTTQPNPRHTLRRQGRNAQSALWRSLPAAPKKPWHSLPAALDKNCGAPFRRLPKKTVVLPARGSKKLCGCAPVRAASPRGSETAPLLDFGLLGSWIQPQWQLQPQKL